MTDWNYSILANNIRMQMKKQNLNQQRLIDLTGINQSHFSKSLSETGKNRFTLEQVVSIANVLNVSIETLMMPSNHTTPNLSFSCDEICLFFTHLLEEGIISQGTIRVPETVYVLNDDPYDDSGSTFVRHPTENTYQCFYFSNYIDTDEILDEDKLYNQLLEFEQGGNLNTKSETINKFFEFYTTLYNLYKNQNLTLDDFKQIIKDRLNNMSSQ